ncbi:6-phosphogluconolactonase [Hyphococcus luteus]|uniref:6-phosphogluconolactonase n=1 Tax=Hyphococcus luteus TaxID=2058213 RepID=A0A2S7K4F1_9PROT|nr:6-phosphogluconolactonase [Marinicaulis flavus]PQA86563.1 6-phosphogluconolactonase [Marinicaulis flavus]PQA86996.1 6-phosphogluconolactonase [Marinicaulis flavus]PQA87361.1 6-phosphogluconolactonase [Marinicaulis flavus]PQA89299.1 6-phosphogluconolactonase [Marinicaulis flavus]
MKRIDFASRDDMAEQLAGDVADRLRRALEERGGAAMALSGGSTPAGLYEALSKRDLDWANVTAALVDERWVAPGEEGSNESFVCAKLQQNRAADVRFVGMWSDAPTPAEGLAAAEARYETVKGSFDVVVLGMGPDGHTASWFPHAQGLGRALDAGGVRLAAVKAQKSAVTGEHLDRMTLTLGAVSEAHYICLLMTGVEKRSVFEQALKAGPVEDMPVRAIIRMRPDLSVCWAP